MTRHALVLAMVLLGGCERTGIVATDAAVDALVDTGVPAPGVLVITIVSGDAGPDAR